MTSKTLYHYKKVHVCDYFKLNIKIGVKIVSSLKEMVYVLGYLGPKMYHSNHGYPIQMPPMGSKCGQSVKIKSIVREMGHILGYYTVGVAY